ncbi:hypothetical protein [Dysgonomonas sp. 25]|uniref:hypothetical protein n=1 Tax=Dysgonomonas sp. 25 TaxID=2302933 RepID=UPI0013D5D2CC|nr:hypothetical protein [Dysgonomonas sp. 25]
MKTLSLEQMEVVRGGACASEYAGCMIAAVGWAASFGTGIGAVIGAAGFGYAYYQYMSCINQAVS